MLRLFHSYLNELDFAYIECYALNTRAISGASFSSAQRLPAHHVKHEFRSSSGIYCWVNVCISNQKQSHRGGLYVSGRATQFIIDTIYLRYLMNLSIKCITIVNSLFLATVRTLTWSCSREADETLISFLAGDAIDSHNSYPPTRVVGPDIELLIAGLTLNTLNCYNYRQFLKD